VLEVYLEILFKSFDLEQIVKLFDSQFDPQRKPTFGKNKRMYKEFVNK
jgi:superfamily II helicase